jgi:hypothetical protein
LQFGVETAGGLIQVAIGFAGGSGCFPRSAASSGLQKAGDLSYVGLSGHLAGVFLWPAVIAHVILTAVLTWALARDKEMNT